MNTNETDATLSDEHASDLAALENAASGGGGGGGELVAQAAPAADPAQEVAALLGFVVAIAGKVLPYLPAIYTPAIVEQIAQAYIPVAEKYGWQTGGGLFEKFGPEIALGMAIGPALWQTRIAHAEFVVERERAARAAEEAASRPPVGEGMQVAENAAGGDLMRAAVNAND